mmetsp:Transcript_10267/g.15069  ORF Transcript_10267/g.15069 Transcript_10267/m.15069 type:complete len:554 (+) Transcript_10267:81-1742(+)
MINYVILGAAVALGRYYGGKEDIRADVAAFSNEAMKYTSVLESIAIVLLVVAVIAGIIVFFIDRQYKNLVKNNHVALDAWVQQPEGPNLKSKIQLVFTYWMSAGGHKIRSDPVPLAEQESTFMKGLKVVVEEGKEDSVPHKKSSDCIVVGTIRMGFGHHRIAYAACSWSLKSNKKKPTYFHDFLNIESAEATLIKDMDKWYSKGSRLASELGGTVEKIWGNLTLSGDADALRSTYQMAEAVKPLLTGLPKDTPIVASHCLVALAAVAAGFTNVINLVIDNHAQWFVVVPGALNLVQGPTNYAQLLRMGVPPEEIQMAGAWIPCDLVDNLNKDCNARIARAKSNNKPLRILIPVGGAGAQRLFVTKLVKALMPRVRKGDIQLFLNAGDHEHMSIAFKEVLDANSQDYDTVDTIEGVHAFCDNLRAGREASSAVTLFAFKDYFPAVATTDLVSRVTDVLACKPSELAFYPVPKLMIRRVGDHEAYSALRASELGDGTLEARELEDCLRFIELFKDIPGSPLLVNMNNMIMENGKIGLYDGCKNAIEIASKMKGAK